MNAVRTLFEGTRNPQVRSQNHLSQFDSAETSLEKFQTNKNFEQNLDELEFLLSLIAQVESRTASCCQREVQDCQESSCDSFTFYEHANDLTSVLQDRLKTVQKRRQGKRSQQADVVALKADLSSKPAVQNKAQKALKILANDAAAALKMSSAAFSRNNWNKYQPLARESSPRCNLVFQANRFNEAETTLGYVSEDSDTDHEEGDVHFKRAPYEGTCVNGSPIISRPKDVGFGVGSIIHDCLDRQGYYVWPGNSVSTTNLSTSIQSLVEDGWPATFVFLFDQTWDIVFDLWDLAAPVLGQECLLEPTFSAAFCVPGRANSDAHTLSADLSQPCRNYSSHESVFADGYEQLIQAWIPLTEGVSDGGFCVVPRELDESFDEDGANNPIDSKAASNNLGINFDFSGLRCLEAPVGSVFLLRGNLIHWMTRPKPNEQPQASLSCTFRHMQSGDFAGPGLSREYVRSLDRAGRLRLVCHSLLQHPNIKEGSLPKLFWDKLPEKIKTELKRNC